tara:strand:+ start:245 stop:622 length:378 start_codon:yes stop_codon:yes gene_type:complete
VKVTFGKEIKKHLLNFSEQDRQKILNFALHVIEHGFNLLPGKNKRSDGFRNDDPLFASKMALVKKYNLWHYHIGIPFYTDSPSGEYKTSEYILHYMKRDDSIEIVYLGRHPPFSFPPHSCLEPPP